MFKEDNTTEQMILSTLQQNGWKYIPADKLQRDYSDIYVESMVKNALIRLNPVIAKDPSKADEVIFRLRALFLSTNQQNLVTQNEAFKQFVFEKNSYPFGRDGRQIAVQILWDGDQWKARQERVCCHKPVGIPEKGSREEAGYCPPDQRISCSCG